MSDIIEKKLSAQETMDLIKSSTLKLLAELEHTETQHTTIRDITDKVVAETGVRVSIINGLVPLICNSWMNDGFGTVSKGRSGGVQWGEKKVRIDPRKRCGECGQVVRNSAAKSEEV